jgi:gliding motility-associated-like protein
MKYFYVLIFNIFYISVFSQVTDTCKISLGNDVSICKESKPAIGFSTPLKNAKITWDGTVPNTCSNCNNFYYPNTSGSGSYFIYVKAESGTCKVSDTLTLTVLPQIAPNVYFINDPTICENQKISLGNSGNNSNYTYTWASEPAGFSSTSNNPSVIPTNTTTYFVTVTNGACPIPFLDTIKMTVFKFQTLEIPKGDTIVCKNTSIMLCKTPSQTGVSYLWNPTTYLTDPKNLNTTALPSNNITYQLEVKSANCKVYYLVSLKTTELQIQLATPDTLAICKGEQATVSLSKSLGIGALSWYQDGVKLSQFDNLATLKITPSKDTKIEARFQNGGCIAKDSSFIRVLDSFKDTYFSVKDSAFCKGQSVNIKAIAPKGSFPSGTTFTWNIANNSFFSLKDSLNFIANTSSTINLTVKNGLCSSSFSKKFEVKDFTPIKILTNDTKACEGGLVNIDIAGNLGTNILKWYENGVLNTSLTGKTPITIFPKVNTKIIAEVGSGQCASRDSVQYNVFENYKDAIITLSDTVLCKGKTFKAYVTNPSGGLPAGTNFAWSVPNTTFSTKGDTITLVADTSSFIQLLLTNQACKANVNKGFTVKNGVALTISSSKTKVCEGEEFTLEAQNPSTEKIEWLPDVSKDCQDALCNKVKTKIYNKTTFSVKSKNNACATTNTITVDVKPSPDIKYPNKTIFCIGDKLDSIALNAAPDAQTAYTWQSKDDLTFQTSNAAAPKVKPSKTAVYTVKMNKNGCLAENQVKIIVANDGFFKMPSDTTICSNTSIELKYSTNITPIKTTWVPGGSNPAIVIFPKDSAIYKVTVEYKVDGETCEISGMVKVKTTPSPTVDLSITSPTIEQDSVYYGENIVLAATNPSQPISKWEFFANKDLIPSNISTVTYDNIKKNTVFSVKVYNKLGCSSALLSLKEIFIKQQKRIFPLAFAPDGETATNKNFRPFSKIKDKAIIQVSSLKVFNRWGNIVYETQQMGWSETDGWNGTINAEAAPSDTYIYQCTYKINGETKTETGEVTLIR